MKDVELPPVGTTAEGEVFSILSVLVAFVEMIPLVRPSVPFTSIRPLVLIDNPEALFTSRLLNALVPEKLPMDPPSVCAADPEKETVAFGPLPAVKAPVL